MNCKEMETQDEAWQAYVAAATAGATAAAAVDELAQHEAWQAYVASQPVVDYDALALEENARMGPFHGNTLTEVLGFCESFRCLDSVSLQGILGSEFAVCVTQCTLLESRAGRRSLETVVCHRLPTSGPANHRLLASGL